MKLSKEKKKVSDIKRFLGAFLYMFGICFSSLFSMVRNETADTVSNYSNIIAHELFIAFRPSIFFLLPFIICGAFLLFYTNKKKLLLAIAIPFLIAIIISLRSFFHYMSAWQTTKMITSDYKTDSFFRKTSSFPDSVGLIIVGIRTPTGESDHAKEKLLEKIDTIDKGNRNKFWISEVSSSYLELYYYP